MPTIVPVVINRSSGNSFSSDSAKQLNQAFKRQGMEVNIALVKPSGLESALARAASDAPGLIVAGGGDGTISLAAGIAHENGLALGIIPSGTLNHFAKDLGLPLDIEAAVEVIAKEKRRRVDLGEINGRIFINNVSLGLYPRAVKQRQKMPWLAWAGSIIGTGWALLEAYRNSPPQRVLLDIEGERLPINSHMIFIGNNRYIAENANPINRQSLDQGVLEILWAPPPGGWGLMLKSAASWALGGGRLNDLNSRWTESATIESPRRRLRVVCDGELLKMAPPLNLLSRPGALEVLAG